MSRNAFIRGPKSLTISYEGKVYTIPSGAQADSVLQCIKEGKWEEAIKLADVSTAINDYSKGEIVVKDGAVYVDGEALPTRLSSTVISFMEEKAPYQSLIKFWKRLRKNPSFRAINELYGFLEASNIPILDDGRILTYKVVKKAPDNTLYRRPGTYNYGKVTVVTKGGTPSYCDIHSGKVLQGIGDVVSMERSSVDDDKDRTCSYGLHLCSWSYTSKFGNAYSGTDVVVECALDPAHVVSIPSDYNNSKLRCTEYEILGVNADLTERRSAYVGDYSLDTDDDCYDDCGYDRYDDDCEDDEEEEGNYWNDGGTESFIIF